MKAPHAAFFLGHFNQDETKTQVVAEAPLSDENRNHFPEKWK